MRAEFISANYLAPRHWPYWLLIAVQRLLVLLPWALQRGIGSLVGIAAGQLATRRRSVVDHNLALAYPRLTQGERQTLRRRHFRELGIGLMQIGMAWWASDRRIAALCDIRGLEHLPSRDRPEACFLVSAHFTTLDMVARGIGLFAAIDVMHRPLGIPFIDAVTRHARQRFAGTLIDKHQPRSLVSRLREAATVWIAVDQADTTEGAIMAPFFGTPALTNTTVSRLAGRYHASVLPVSCVRSPDGRFRIVIEAPLPAFGDDALADATLLNATFERQIASAPAQYFWVHRRFKAARSEPA